MGTLEIDLFISTKPFDLPETVFLCDLGMFLVLRTYMRLYTDQMNHSVETTPTLAAKVMVAAVHQLPPGPFTFYMSSKVAVVDHVTVDTPYRNNASVLC
jgi:hypothetical protein